MRAELFLPLIVLLPLLGAVLNLVFYRRESSRGLIAFHACAFVSGAFLATLGAFKGLAALPAGETLHFTVAQWGPVAGPEGDKFVKVGFLGDQISIWFALVVTGVGFLIHMFSAWYMADDTDFRRYFAKLNYFIFAMSLLVMADGYAGLAMGWANVGFASYSLIGFWRTKEAPPTAAIKAFVVNLIGELGLFVGVAAIWLNFGTVSYYEVFPKVGEVDPAIITFIGLFLLWAACAKSAQLPLHVWLPDAMQGPTSVSALIHAATMVTAGVYLTARSYPIYQASETASMALATVGALSALFGALCATCAYDIKRVLAFSTMSQIGYMMLGVGAGAFIPALFHFQTHAFFKALLFLTSGAIIHALAGEQDIRRMGGLGKKDKFIWLMFLVGTLALGGMPGFSGFFSKDEILGEVLANGHPILWGIGVLTAGITAFYCVRLFTLTFGGQVGPAVAAAYEGGHGPCGHDSLHGHDAQADAHGGHGSDSYAAHGGEEDEEYEDEEYEDDHAHGHGHHGGGFIMWFPLVVLAFLSVAAGIEGIPALTHIAADYLGPYFTRFTEAHEGVHHVNFGAIGVVVAVSAIAAMVSYGLYRPGGSRREAALDMTRPASGILYSAFYVDNLYEAVIVRPALWIADVVGHGIDPNFVDGAVNGVASVADWVGGGVRGLHDGLIRRYALSIVIGVVAFLAYFVWI